MAFAVKYYPHNDLGNLAHYHLETINRKMASDEQEGIALDCMSFLIALAFSVEALINFVGSKRVEDWRERDSYGNKVKTLAKSIGLILDPAAEPKITLGILKEVRDGMAHGKPAVFKALVQSGSELRQSMAGPWDAYLDPAFCNHAYQQITGFKRTILAAAGIELVASLTSASGGW